MLRITRLVAAFALVFAFLALPPRPSRAQSPATQPGVLVKLKVVDAQSKQPIPGVNVTLSTSCATEDQKKKQTDESGVAAFTVSEREPAFLNLVAKKPGHVPMRVTWQNGRGKSQPLPDEYILELPQGTKIGGRVVDNEGKPVPKATVVFWLRSRGSADKAKPNESISLTMESVKADENGAWSFDSAPASLDSFEVGAWSHQCAISGGTYPINKVEPVASLRDGTATTVLERGVPIEGTVYGSDGKPLAKASVGTGGDRVPSNTIPAIRTDDNGKFTFNAKPGDLVVVTVKADKHAPDLKQFTVAAKNEPLEFRLEAGKTLKGRVVDAAGKPVAGVTLYADTWRGNRTLGNRLTTKEDGTFVWDGAPADAVQMDIMKQGYADLRNHAMTASDTDAVVTLRKPLVVKGSVVDAETGKPVDSFHVVQGITFDGGKRISWQRRDGDEVKPRPNGTFEFETSFPYPGYAVRVEADGYKPADSRVYTMDEQNVELSFKLEKGQSLRGVVRAPDGKPAAGAKIVVATKDTGAYIRNGAEVHDQGNIQATADKDGGYALPVMDGDYTILALHESGYAERASGNVASEGSDLKLTAWGRIEGTATIGTRAASGAELSLHNRDERHDPAAPSVHHDVSTKADANGKFVFERVRPGSVNVSRIVRIPMSASSWMSAPTHTAVATIKPGETATVKLGGTGRPVVGRLEIPPQVMAEPVWIVSQSQIMTKNAPAPIPGLEAMKDKTPEERRAWHEAFMASDAGKAYQEAENKRHEQFRTYMMPVEKDGSFRAEDIPAGTYTVNIQISKVNAQGMCGPGDELATGSAEFTVPEMPDGRSDEPLEIPTVSMKLTKNVGVGDVAPAFAFKTLDGKDAKLEDFKGKYVFLDFWATWCGPCVAETPNLKAAYDAHGADERFVMIGLSLDDGTDAPTAYAKKNDTKWVQGYLGEWSKTEVPNLYGVKGIPATFLIGPDGKVIAKNLRGTQVKDEIAKALAR